MKINGKNISFNLSFINKYLFYHPYVTMPNMSLNLVYNTTYLIPASKVLKYLRKN